MNDYLDVIEPSNMLDKDQLRQVMKRNHESGYMTDRTQCSRLCMNRRLCVIFLQK